MARHQKYRTIQMFYWTKPSMKTNALTFENWFEIAYTSIKVNRANAATEPEMSAMTINSGLAGRGYLNFGSAGTPPSSGDTCYSDSAGTTVLLAGYYNLDSNTGVGNRSYIEIGASGVVDFGYPQTC